MFRFTYKDSRDTIPNEFMCSFNTENLEQAYRQFINDDGNCYNFICYLSLFGDGIVNDTVAATVKSLKELDGYIAIYNTFKTYPDFIIKAFFEEVAKFPNVTIGPSERKTPFSINHVKDTTDIYITRVDYEKNLIFHNDSRKVIVVSDFVGKVCRLTPEIKEFCKKYNFIIGEWTAKPGFSLIPITHSNVSVDRFGVGVCVESDFINRRFVVKTTNNGCVVVGVANIEGNPVELNINDKMRASRLGLIIDSDTPASEILKSRSDDQEYDWTPVNFN